MLVELADHAVGTVKWAKQDKARDADGDYDRAEMPPLVVVYRGGQPVVFVYLMRGGRDEILWTARVAASGFGADMLVVTFETFGSEWDKSDGEVGLSPLTGQPWAPGEMQVLADHHQGREKGWVTDALMVFAYNRAGDSQFRQLSYRLEGREVVWMNERGASDDARMTGAVVRGLAEAMNAPAIDQLMPQAGLSPQAYGLDAEEARIHMDCATTKFLLAVPVVDVAVALVGETPKFRRIMHESFAGTGFDVRVIGPPL